MPKVGIVMGSDSDLACMSEAAEILKNLGIEHEITVASAHRSPGLLAEYVSGAEPRGVAVFIAGAGGAAHLPGVIAALTPLPVIGVPMLNKALAGADSLYSIAQMPSGIPVATMAIGGAKNAGIFAATILGVGDKEVRERVREYKRGLERGVREKSEKLANIGYKAYLDRGKT